MTRYYYGLVLTTMLVNTVFYLPFLMINDRYNGTIMAIVAATISGGITSILFVKAIRKFPGQGLPEIYRAGMPLALAAPLLVFAGIMWLISGGFVLLSYAGMIQRFINPDFNYQIVVVFLIIVCGWLATTESWSILYLLVLVLVINLPILAFILFKALGSNDLNLDAMRVVAHYYDQVPSIIIFCATTYVFSGFINLAIFNRCFDDRYKVKYLWALPLIGFCICITTFFIPIGLNGTKAVGNFIYVWVSTSDALRLTYGFIERMLYVYILLYSSICILFICVAFHAGAELIRGAIVNPAKEKSVRRHVVENWILFAVCGLILLWAGTVFNEKQLIQLAKGWFIIRYAMEWLSVVLMVWMARRLKA